MSDFSSLINTLLQKLIVASHVLTSVTAVYLVPIPTCAEFVSVGEYTQYLYTYLPYLLVAYFDIYFYVISVYASVFLLLDISYYLRLKIGTITPTFGVTPTCLC